MAQLHLGLEAAELIRHARLGLGANLLAGPLLHAVEALVDIHGCGVAGGIAWVCWGGMCVANFLAIRKGWFLVSCALVLGSIDSVVCVLFGSSVQRMCDVSDQRRQWVYLSVCELGVGGRN